MAISAARSLMLRSDFVCLSTLEADGFPDTRLVFNLLKMRADVLGSGPAMLPEAFGNWLGTNTSSRKMAQLRKDSRLCLYFSDTATFEGLSLQGTAEEVFDPAIREVIWMNGWEMYYPGGREGGDFSLLRFHPLRGRYYHGLQVLDFDARGQA